MSKQGILTVVSGFSGAGKGTLMKQLLSKYNYSLSISATTRAPRDGEVDGREYFFLTRERFESMIENGELIEWAEYVGNYYGTPKQYVQNRLKEGHDVILEIEVQGALRVREQFPEALLLFITPPNAMELRNRLVNRGTESIEKIEQRLSRAYDEAEYMKCYDYIVVNDVLQDCVEQLNGIIEIAHCKISQNTFFMETMKEELKAFKKGDL